MKILLLGEYSKLHNSLKAGLEKLDLEVTLAAAGDGFKNFPSDFSYAPKLTTNNRIFKFFKRVIFRLCRIDLRKTECGIRFFFLLRKLKGFDRVQVINSDALQTHPRWSRFLLKRLFKQNGKVSLLVCGDETPVTDYLLKKEMRYSVLTPYFENPKIADRFHYVLKYSQKNYRKTFEMVCREATVMISSDIDYKLALDQMGYENILIPNPVIIEGETKKTQRQDQITIFLGINRLSFDKKGISFFQEALRLIKNEYGDRVNIRVVENLPYKDYVKTYKEADILLDMVYAYDQGYNALEAMAAGKVVFTGAEQEFLQYYGLQEDEVCINALPHAKILSKELSRLLDHPAKIEEIGHNARKFVKEHHHYMKVAKRYLSAWDIALPSAED